MICTRNSSLCQRQPATFPALSYTRHILGQKSASGTLSGVLQPDSVVNGMAKLLLAP